MVLAEAPYLDRATILRKLPNITYEEAQAVLSSEEVLLARQMAMAQALEQGTLEGKDVRQIEEEQLDTGQEQGGNANL